MWPSPSKAACNGLASWCLCIQLVLSLPWCPSSYGRFCSETGSSVFLLRILPVGWVVPLRKRAFVMSDSLKPCPEAAIGAKACQNAVHLKDQLSLAKQLLTVCSRSGASFSDCFLEYSQNAFPFFFLKRKCVLSTCSKERHSWNYSKTSLIRIWSEWKSLNYLNAELLNSKNAHFPFFYSILLLWKEVCRD